MQCLDIPIPRTCQALLRQTPFRRVRAQDSQALDLIRDFGQQQAGRPDYEVERACDLASGPSDIVIVLELPHVAQNCAGDLDGFVANCPTLRAVDELVRFASRGARGIESVTVLDIFSFLVPAVASARGGNTTSTTRGDAQGWRCVLEHVLELKQPKVILYCWNEACDHTFASPLFGSFGPGAWPISQQLAIAGTTTTLIRSFHPAAAFFPGQHRVHMRMLLICHFIVAFSSLSGPVQIPDWIRGLCEASSREERLASKPQTTDDGGQGGLIDPQFSGDGTTRVLRVLRAINGELEPPGAAIVLTEGAVAKQRHRVNYLLRRLFASDYSNGSLDIARLCLLWKTYGHAEQKEVLTRLMEIGSRQEFFEPRHQPPTLEHPTGLSWQPGLVFHDARRSAEDDDDSELQRQLKALRIVGAESPNAHAAEAIMTEQENAVLVSLQIQLYRHRAFFEQTERRALDIAAHIQLSIKLHINAPSPDKVDISAAIAELHRSAAVPFDETANLVDTMPAILSAAAAADDDDDDACQNDVLYGGGNTQYHMHPRQRRAIMERPDGREILDRLIDAVESLVDLGFRVSLLLAGLLAQGRLLLSVDNEAGSAVRVGMACSVDLEGYVRRMQGGVAGLLAMRYQLAMMGKMADV